jgi:Leucine-rich repeat (LRR) protein
MKHHPNNNSRMQRKPDFIKLQLAILFFGFFGCQSKQDDSLFAALKEQTTVVISLKEYHLDNIPPAIKSLRGVKRLTIVEGSSMEWTAYPPLSALGEGRSDSIVRYLPGEITELTSLEYLSLFNLSLVSLPADLYKLKNLDTLILAFNKLNISSQIEKLGAMTQLKYLDLAGNVVTKKDLARLKSAMPGTTIFP